jgi:signal transduction histidine kinase
MTLPNKDHSAEQFSAGAPPIKVREKDVNILLVDDKPARLLSYEVALESLGYNLVRAESGTQALERLMEMEFAAILLDVSMPEMDGFETASLIHQHPRFEETPIIFITGVHITDIDSLKGYAVGAVDYIFIPVIPEILRGKVQALVQLYLQRVELSRLNRELAQANANLASAHEDLKASNMRELKQLNETLEGANSDLLIVNARLTEEVVERQKAEQELNRLSRRKDEYIAILAHELRNPLSAIHNAVQVMGLQKATPHHQQWAQELLQRQVKHLTCLMDDLLDVSRISQGRIELRYATVDLATVVSQSAETVAPLIKECGHSLKIDLPTEKQPLLVNGDSVRLTQVLDNLLTNAAKYMETGGEVTLSLGKDSDGYAVIRVRDQGLGIPEDLLNRVFDLFVQAPTAANRRHGGLGIGLALVRALVEMHDGTVTVSSEGADRGSEFSVRLPLLAATTPMPAPELNSSLAANDAALLRILLIDDNEDSARALAVCLEVLGYTVAVAKDGESGLKSATEFDPDVILLDIGLPDIDGYDVAIQLRSNSLFDKVTIIAMTGFSGDAERRRADAAGFNHYLVKPVNYGGLTALLEKQVAPPRVPTKRVEVP